MSDYVLFSPLGRSDPSRGCRDGAFIHICRLYKPKKVYLFMSKEICNLDSIDDKYEVYLNKLCKKLTFACETVKIKRPELVDVHDFDAFYGDFTAIIEQICNENPDCEILLNLSSGTPQMKSALNIVSILSPRHLIPVQVSSPAKKSNDSKPVDETYDIELEWECNEDNYAESYENRCTISENQNLNARIKYEIIAKHVSVYDYKAAITVAQTICDFIDPRMMNLLRAGEQRLLLDIGKAEMFARSAGYNLLPIKGKAYSQKAMICFEYILGLKIKLERGELADFVRAVSPVLTDLFELYLREKCDIDLEKFYECNGKDKNHKILSRNSLPADILKILDEAFSGKGGYRDKEPCAANLCSLIAAKGESEACKLATKLRNFEKKARNIAAHEIIAVTEKWVKDKVGFGTQEILKMLQRFLTYSISFSKDAWDSYDKLNEAILKISLIK